MREDLPFVQRPVSRGAGNHAVAAFLSAFDTATDEGRRDAECGVRPRFSLVSGAARRPLDPTGR